VLYRDTQAAAARRRRVTAAAHRIGLVGGRKPYQWRHGWVAITPAAIRVSAGMAALLRGGDSSAPLGRDDPILGEIARQNGFDALPQLVDPDRFQSAIDGGQPEMWRAVPEQRYVEQFKTGDYFPGSGIHGNGTYALGLVEHSPGRAADLQDDISAYGAARIRMTFAPGPYTITAPDLEPLQQADLDTLKEERAALRRKIRAAEDDTRDLEDQLDMLNTWITVNRDPGRWAALNGYDAVLVEAGRWSEGMIEVVVLNRGALLVDRSV
jgi:hypothetical protein